MNIIQILTYRPTIILFLIWTGLMSFSIIWDMEQTREQVMDQAYATARANLNKDITFRRWGTNHGGIYVPISETQRPIPWMAHVDNRDVTTTGGKQLTLLNPATMLRQMMDRYAADYGVRGRITGLKYLNPGNKPDEWEREQLLLFSQGEIKEVWSVEEIDGEPYLRHLRAMYMKKGCEKCHAILGFKEGDFRGATGLNFPLAEHYALIEDNQQYIKGSHTLFWLVGLVGIIWSGVISRQRMLDRLRNRELLEQKVKDRTAELSAARDEAEQANTAKSEFLSRMSHELRTPLNAILGFGQLVEADNEQKLSNLQTENMHEIMFAGHHLLDLVNEILDLSSIESDRIEVSLKPVALMPIIESCVNQLQPLAQQRNITIDMSLDAACSVEADDIRLKQVFLNLISNAVKYNRDGGSIRIRCNKLESQRSRISVEDTGRGLAADILPRLFKPFERLESAYDGVEGTGIGLALAKRLVEVMGGEIGVESEPGQGSTFWFELPTASGACEVVSPIESEQTIDKSDSTNTILYIEDNPANLRLVQKLFAINNYHQFMSAENGEIGLDVAQQQLPDLILLDINLPGMDGFEVLKKLRENPSTQNIPVVAVSANAMPRDLELAKAAGFDDYVTKPIDVSRFFKTIDQCLNNSGESQK